MIVNASVAGISATARNRALARLRELIAARETELRATYGSGRSAVAAETSGPSQAIEPQPTRGK